MVNEVFFYLGNVKNCNVIYRWC